MWASLLALSLPLPAFAKPAVGVVTRLLGQVELTRPPAATPVALQFKDDLFLRDVIDTRENAMARMLFGGRSSVTVRELTRFEVRAEVLPSGATRTVYDLADGKIRVIVAPELMRPGDEVEIRTPNAVAGIRGTTIVVERNRQSDTSTFKMVDDCATITPQRGQTTRPFSVCKGTKVAMVGSQVGPVERMTADEVNQLQAEFALGSSHPDEANREAILQTHVRTAEQLMTAVGESVGGQATSVSEGTNTAGAVTADPRTAGGTGEDIAPAATPTPTPPPAPLPKVNIVANPGFETGDFTGWTVFNQVGSNGSFFIQMGTAPNINVGTVVPAPPGGVFAAMTDSGGPGSHILYQDLVIPANGMLSFDLFVGNRNAVFVTPATLDFTAGANQQARVDLMDPAAALQDVGAGVVQNLFQTNVGDANISGYNTFVFDVSLLAGQNLRLRFAEVDNQFFFQFGVDNVSLTDPAFPGDLVLQGAGASRTVSESVLRLGTTFEVGTDPAIAGDLLDVRDGGRIVMDSAAPVVLFDGATVVVGTADTTAFDSPNRLIHLRGVNVDPATGLGTDQPIAGNGVDPAPFGGAMKPIGVLLEAVNGTIMAVHKGAGDTAGGNALYLDTALLEATLPIIRLIGSASAQTVLDTDDSTLDLFKSKVVALGPIVALDRSFINVQNGPLIRLTDGSTLIVSGDLLSLINGSRINVLNGPLASVDGAGSLLSVSGALVQFGGTGGNQIVVNNGITPTATLSGLPVSATTGGSISIGPNPVKNPSLGSVTVNGSLISATQGGKVNITAP